MERTQQQLPPSSFQLEQQLLNILLDTACPQMDWTLENKRVLVVGCGNGEVMLQVLFPRLPPDAIVVAADHRDDLLLQALARFSQPRLYFIGLDTAVPDIEASLAWPLGPYSKVFSFFYLQSVRDQNRALENIYKLLVPGGEVLLVLVIHTAVDALYQALARSSLWELYVEDYRHFVTPYQFQDNPKEVLQSYLEEAGFHIKSCSSREAILASESIEVIQEGVKATNLPHDRLPDQLRNLYLQECIDELRANGKLSRGSTPRRGLYYYKYTALVAHAVKR